MRFVMITAQVDRFYAVTPEWEISFSYMSLVGEIHQYEALENYTLSLSIQLDENNKPHY